MQGEKPNEKSILGMSGGALIERVDLAMSSIIENILDPNTKATEKRSITVKIEFQPDENRETAIPKATVTTKLAATNSISTMVHITSDGNGELAIYEATPQIPGQRRLDGSEQEEPARLRLVA